MIFQDIIEYVEKQFEIKSQNIIKDGILYLRMVGIDDASLARYIKYKFDVKVTTKQIEGYKLFNNDWIKIENVDTKIST